MVKLRVASTGWRLQWESDRKTEQSRLSNWDDLMLSDSMTVDPLVSC